MVCKLLIEFLMMLVSLLVKMFNNFCSCATLSCPEMLRIVSSMPKIAQTSPIAIKIVQKYPERLENVQKDPESSNTLHELLKYSIRLLQCALTANNGRQ